MTLEELKTILSGTRLPVSYSNLPIGENARPYIVYYQTGVNNFAADGIAYFSAKRFTIVLYSDNRDRVSEGLIETALSTAGIFWNKTEDYLDNDKLFSVIYEIEV